MTRTFSGKSTSTTLFCLLMSVLCGVAQSQISTMKGARASKNLMVRQGTVRTITLPPQREIRKEESDHIKQLIAGLAQVDSPDLEYSDRYNGWHFPPLKGTEPVGAMLLVDPKQHPSQPMEALVRLGPTALPYLLDALTDSTPTKLTLHCPPWDDADMKFVRELPINTLNPRELQARDAADFSLRRKDLPLPLESNAPQYTLTIGDLCMVTIGQIGCRPYQAAHQGRDPVTLINSPCLDPGLAGRIRTIWSSKAPAQHLLDSLLLDYAMEGVSNGALLDDFWEASLFQVEAARRLLFYFPDQTVPLIAERLHGLKFDSPVDSLPFKVANGVNVIDFLRAVAWCKDPRIQKELEAIVQRTKDLDVIVACHSNVQIK